MKHFHSIEVGKTKAKNLLVDNYRAKIRDDTFVVDRNVT